MKFWKISEKCTVYQLVSGRSNAYAIDLPDSLILVDSSEKVLYNKMLAAIENIKGSKKVTHLILTHSHYDHCFNASVLQEKYGVTIVAGEAEVSMLKEGFTPPPPGIAPLAKFIVNCFGNYLSELFRYKPVLVDVSIMQEIVLHEKSAEIRILPTPGHSKGSISVIVDKKIAIVGDAIFGVFRKTVFPPFGEDENEMILSIKRLYETGCDIFLPGHGRVVTKEKVKRELKKFGF